MRSAGLKFVIHAPTFDETSGGAIALHLLCHRLNLSGIEALLWPAPRPLVRIGDSPGRMWWGLQHKLSGSDRVWLRDGWQPALGPYVPPCAPERRRFGVLCT